MDYNLPVEGTYVDIAPTVSLIAVPGNRVYDLFGTLYAGYGVQRGCKCACTLRSSL